MNNQKTIKINSQYLKNIDDLTTSNKNLYNFIKEFIILDIGEDISSYGLRRNNNTVSKKLDSSYYDNLKKIVEKNFNKKCEKKTVKCLIKNILNEIRNSKEDIKIVKNEIVDLTTEEEKLFQKYNNKQI